MINKLYGLVRKLIKKPLLHWPVALMMLTVLSVLAFVLNYQYWEFALIGSRRLKTTSSISPTSSNISEALISQPQVFQASTDFAKNPAQGYRGWYYLIPSEGPFPTPTPPPLPSVPPQPRDTTTNKVPIAAVDFTNFLAVGGWAFDPDQPSASPEFEIHFDGLPGSSTHVIKSNPLHYSRRQDINDYYQITGNHGFFVDTPARFQDGKPHSVYVLIKDVNNPSGNIIASGSPKTYSSPDFSPSGNKLTQIGAYDKSRLAWIDTPTGASIAANIMDNAYSSHVVRAWRAPAAGYVTVEGTASRATTCGADTVEVKIVRDLLSNPNPLWKASINPPGPKGNDIHSFSKMAYVASGNYIYFVVSSKPDQLSKCDAINIDPKITFTPALSGMKYLVKGNTKIGFNLDWGGAISEIWDGSKQLVDNIGTGRLIQTDSLDGRYANMTHEVCAGEGLDSSAAGNHKCWGPGEGGDIRNNGGPTVYYSNDGNSVTTRMVPIDFQADRVIINDIKIEKTVTFIDERTIKFTSKLVPKNGYYPYASNDSPAIFLAYPYSKAAIYLGDKPWTDGNLLYFIPTDEESYIGQHFDYLSEQWIGLVDGNNYGLLAGYTGSNWDNLDITYNISQGTALGGTTQRIITLTNDFWILGNNPISRDAYFYIGNLNDGRQRFKDLLKPITRRLNAIVNDKTVTATWNNLDDIAELSPRDWIALFKKGETDDQKYLDWKYLNTCRKTADTSTTPYGSCQFAVTNPDTYEFRIFPNDTFYPKIITSNRFTMVSPSVKAYPLIINPGETTTVEWSNILNPTKTDWVALYKAGETNNSNYLDWVYLNSCTKTAGFSPKPNGSCSKFSIKSEGTYEFRVFANNGWALIGTSNPIKVFLEAL